MNCYFLSKTTEKPFDHARGWQAANQAEEGERRDQEERARCQEARRQGWQGHRKEIKKSFPNFILRAFFITLLR